MRGARVGGDGSAGGGGGRFRFAPMPRELERMNDELDALGGGDARVGKVTVVCRVVPSFDDAEVLSVSAMEVEGAGGRARGGGGGDPMQMFVFLRNPAVAVDTAPAALAVRRFPVDDSVENRGAEDELNERLGTDVVDWVWAGFNATLLAVGHSGTWKTSTLFGQGGFLQEVRAIPLAEFMVKQLYAKVMMHSKSSDFALAMSAWHVLGDSVKDLLAPQLGDGQDDSADDSAPQLPPQDFISIRCTSAKVALSAMKYARKRAGPEVGHIFLRLALMNQKTGNVSLLHVVDLAGEQLTDPPISEYATVMQNSRDPILARKISNQQLSLRQVVHELAAAQRRADSTRPNPTESLVERSYPKALVVSARNSALTKVLAPILQGNSKTWLLACLKNGESHYAANLSTLQMVAEARSLRMACHRVAVTETPEELGFIAAEEVLPLHVIRGGRGGVTSPGSARNGGVPTVLGSSRGAGSTVGGVPGSPGASSIASSNVHVSPGRLPGTALGAGGGGAPLSPHHTYAAAGRSPVLAARVPSAGERFEAIARGSPPRPTPQPHHDYGGMAATTLPPPLQQQQQQPQTHQQPLLVATAPGASGNQEEELNSVSQVIPVAEESGVETMDNEASLLLEAEVADACQSVGRQMHTGANSDELVGNSTSVAPSRPRTSSRASNGDSRSHGSPGPGSVGSSHHSPPRPRDDYSGAQRTGLMPSHGWQSRSARPHSAAGASAAPGNFIASRGGGKHADEDEDADIDSHEGTFLRALQDERESKEKLQKKMQVLEDALMENATRYEAQLESMRLDMMRMQRKVKQAVDDHDFTGFFLEYEKDIGRLQRECCSLRERNIDLELRAHRAAARASEGKHQDDMSPSASPSSSSPTSPARRGVLRSHQQGTQSSQAHQNYQLHSRTVQKLSKECEDLRQQLAALRKRERLFGVNQRVADRANRKSQAVAEENNRLQKDLEGVQEHNAILAAETNRMMDLLRTAEMAEQDLRRERDALGAEVFQLRDQVFALEEERQKASTMFRFVEKHYGTEANGSPGGNGGSGGRGRGGGDGGGGQEQEDRRSDSSAGAAGGGGGNNVHARRSPPERFHSRRAGGNVESYDAGLTDQHDDAEISNGHGYERGHLGADQLAVMDSGDVDELIVGSDSNSGGGSNAGFARAAAALSSHGLRPSAEPSSSRSASQARDGSPARRRYTRALG